MTQAIDEKITVNNTLPVPVEVVVQTRSADGDSDETRFGPVEAEGSDSTTVQVESGGAFDVTAHWTYEGEECTSNTFTANLPEGYPITPLTLTLKMSFDTPDKAQWKGVDWAPPKDEG